jgi:hypothetical protein
MLRIVITTLGVIAVLGLLRFKPWQRGISDRSGGADQLQVGFLPVT